MKKYQELEIEILVLNEQDVVTASGFLTNQQHSFEAPNTISQGFVLGRLEE